KDQEFAIRLERRFQQLALGECAAYLSLLRSPLRGEMELDELVSELTIGETYFYRHQEQFDAIRKIILPQIIQRRKDTRRLKFWSAGCATGAEPYSLAILLEEALSEESRDWHYDI